MTPTRLVIRARTGAAFLLASFLLSASTYAGDVYVLPGGSGNGSDWAHALSPSNLQTAIDNLSPGETIYVGGSATDYTNVDLAIHGSGSAGSPKRIVGMDIGDGLPVFDGGFDVHNYASGSDCLFTFDGATAYWEIKDLRVQNHGWAIDMPLTGETFTLHPNLLFENIAFDTIEDGIRIRNAEHVLVKDCTVIRHTKKAFRIGRYSRYVTFENCHTDATGGDSNFPTRSIPAGFCGDNTGTYRAPIIYDLHFVDCTARNNGYDQSSSAYWNGDGFSTERGTYNVTFTRCRSYDNNDAGFDNKANNVIYDNCISLRNKKGFRVWGTAWLINCLGAYNEKAGGNSSSDGLRVYAPGIATIDSSTFHDNVSSQISNDGESLTAYNTILSVDGVFSTGSTAGSGVALLDCIEYTGTEPSLDPNYVDPVQSWDEGSADAFNSQSFGPDRGYFAQASASSTPTAPSNLTVTLDPTSPRRAILIWTDNADNENGFVIERSSDNVNFSQLDVMGTDAATYADVGLPPSTTYYYRVRASNSLGNSSPSSSTSITTPAVTTPTAPIGLTAEFTWDDDPGEVLLKWTDRSNNEENFSLERSVDNVNFSEIGTTVESLTTFRDTATAAGAVYYYRLRAVNTAGNSAYTNTAKITMPLLAIVDDADATQSGSWTSTAQTEGYYGTGYHHDNAAGSGMSMTFTPTLPASGSYEVHARWTDGSNRADNTPIDIAHNAGTSTVSVNQKYSGGAWNLLGTYSFNSGTSGYARIRDDGANGVVIADAIAFRTPLAASPTAPSGLAATVVSDSQIDLTWTDNASDENSYVIESSFDGTTFARAGSVNANTSSFSCAGLLAGRTYYFRVSANGGAGFSANSNTVSAVTSFEVIRDEADANGIVETGSWTSSNTASGAYLSYYKHDGNTGSSGGKSMRFTPVLPEAGTYEVFARWTQAYNRATNAPYDIVHASGTTTVTRNQQANGGSWNSLGTFTFDAGSGGYVLLRNDGANGYVIADAVKFVRVP